MLTITAPGVETNELDLSFYDFPQPKEETQNVFINGFATQGHTNSPYKFTSKSSDDDLIRTFGTPTNEAERYFYNACSEAIKRDKVVLYANRLPYNNTSTTNFNYAEYEISKVSALPTEVTTDASSLADVGEILVCADTTLSGKNYAEINAVANSNLSCTAEEMEEYRTGVRRPAPNRFIIVDKNQEIYQKIPVDSTHKTLSSRYLLGVLPIVTTATNAMYYQKLIANNEQALSNFEPTDSVFSRGANATIEADYMVYPSYSEDLPVGNKDAMTLSKYAMGFFPTVNIAVDGSFDRDRLKNIGVVVFRGYVDAESGNKIKYEPVEAFAGSLKSDDVDPTSGTSRFIDDIINTNSRTIEFFSNCFNGKISNKAVAAKAPKSSAKSDGELKTTSAMTYASNSAQYEYEDIVLLHVSRQQSQVLGFTEEASGKKISFGQIYQSLDKVFEKNKSRDEMQIDLVVDAGLANIAQFMYSVNDKRDVATNDTNFKNYDPVAYVTNGNSTFSAVQKWDLCDRVGSGPASVAKDGATDAWQMVLKKYDAFCKLRGDCMFIADGLRPLCISGNRKRVTKTNYDSSVVKTINPFMKYITGKIDTSYGCGNCDWYQIVDPTSGVNIWMPPSVKMMCSMLDTTNNKFYWTVPVGVNNGKMNPADNPSNVKVIDIAFSPTTQDAGDIYTKCWNYAKYYEDDGFVLEGQRTFQIRPTAFDRINVRRLFLYLERKTYKAAKYFVYQGNDAYTRQRLVDAITPFFENAKINGGLHSYRIQCDEFNNTPDTIDRNELHVKIAIKPTKAIEFIECTFVALRTGASFTEASMKD